MFRQIGSVLDGAASATPPPTTVAASATPPPTTVALIATALTSFLICLPFHSPGSPRMCGRLPLMWPASRFRVPVGTESGWALGSCPVALQSGFASKSSLPQPILVPQVGGVMSSHYVLFGAARLKSLDGIRASPGPQPGFISLLATRAALGRRPLALSCDTPTRRRRGNPVRTKPSQALGKMGLVLGCAAGGLDRRFRSPRRFGQWPATLACPKSRCAGGAVGPGRLCRRPYCCVRAAWQDDRRACRAASSSARLPNCVGPTLSQGSVGVSRGGVRPPHDEMIAFIDTYALVTGTPIGAGGANVRARVRVSRCARSLTTGGSDAGPPSDITGERAPYCHHLGRDPHHRSRVCGYRRLGRSCPSRRSHLAH